MRESDKPGVGNGLTVVYFFFLFFFLNKINAKGNIAAHLTVHDQAYVNPFSVGSRQLIQTGRTTLLVVCFYKPSKEFLYLGCRLGIVISRETEMKL